MPDILNDLYYGRVTAYERGYLRTAENMAVHRKIENEERYFTEKMSLDDCQRFQTLHDLYAQSGEFAEADAFSYGFRLGVKLMCTVFSNNGGPASE